MNPFPLLPNGTLSPRPMTILTLVYLFLLIIIFLSFPWPALAQYDFDIKTRLKERARLQNVKRGITVVLEDQPWAGVVEIGEDYSLWITDLDRAHRGDSVHVRLTVSLRTPAMLTSGDHLDSQRIHVSYHWNQMQMTAKEMPDFASIAASQAAKYGEALGRIAGLPKEPSRLVLGDLLNTLAKTFYEYPSRFEAVESLLVGREVIKTTREMVTINR